MVKEALNLAGEWVGHYIGHFDEFVRIVQDGSRVEAWKITGDDYVPAGALTWRADLETGRGEGQIAEQEVRNPRLIPGKLVVLDAERIRFEGQGCGIVEFRRDD